MSDATTTDDSKSTDTTDDYASGTAPSENFLGLPPPAYSLSALESSLPSFQTSPPSPSDTDASNLSSGQRAFSRDRRYSRSFAGLNYLGNGSASLSVMSSSTYRSSAYPISKPSVFQQTREKEKFELSTLNEKFADYVEKVRYLEAQNKKIQLDSGLLTDKQDEQCQRIKSIFEVEILQLKEAIENIFKDKTAMTIAAKEAQNSISPLKQHLNQTFKECDSSKYETEKVERQLSSIEGDIRMFQRRLTHQDSEQTQWKQFITHLQRLLLQGKNEGHGEILARTSSEQAVKQLRSEINKLREQHQQKLKDLRQSSIMLGSSSTADRAHVFKSELSNAIRKIRQDFERENDMLRHELYEQFKQAYEDIVRQHADIGHVFLGEREQERIRQDEERVRSEIQRVRTDSNTLKQKNADVKLRIRELQINMEMCVDDNHRIDQLQQNEMKMLKARHEKIAQDYEDVVTKQTSLEKEIQTYSNLLEGTMKPVVDTITDEYNAIAAQQTKSKPLHNRSSSTSEPVGFHRSSSLANMNEKNLPLGLHRSPMVIDIPVMKENYLSKSDYFGYMSGQHIDGDQEIVDNASSTGVPTDCSPVPLD